VLLRVSTQSLSVSIYVVVLQAEGSEMSVVNGRVAADVTDASVTRGGDEVTQTQSRQTTRASSSATPAAGN